MKGSLKMDKEYVAVLILKDQISKMSVEEQAKVNQCYTELSETVKKYKEVGVIALTLLGLETSIEAQRKE